MFFLWICKQIRSPSGSFFTYQICIHLHPTLPPEEVSFLEEDFSIDEVRQAIKDFPLGKSSGTDSFNNKFYKTFIDILSPFLCKDFNAISPTSPFDGLVVCAGNGASGLISQHLLLNPLTSLPSLLPPFFSLSSLFFYLLFLSSFLSSMEPSSARVYITDFRFLSLL